MDNIESLSIEQALKDYSPTSTLALNRYIRRTLEDFQQQLDQRFWQGEPILSILKKRSFWRQEVLSTAWQHFHLANQGIALVALGGFGQGSVHPGSDTDVLLLTKKMPKPQLKQSIAEWIAFIWDCGI